MNGTGTWSYNGKKFGESNGLNLFISPHERFKQNCKDITDIIERMAKYRREELTVIGTGTDKYFIITKSLKRLACIDLFSMTISPTDILKEWIKQEDDLIKKKHVRLYRRYYPKKIKLWKL